jgi:hypothetical protein
MSYAYRFSYEKESPKPPTTQMVQKKCEKCWKIKCRFLEYVRINKLEKITVQNVENFLKLELNKNENDYDHSTPAKILYRLCKSNWIYVWGRRENKGNKKFLIYKTSKKYHSWLKSHTTFLEFPLCVFKEEIKKEKPKVEPKEIVVEEDWLIRGR